jgi:hypothetical protein
MGASSRGKEACRRAGSINPVLSNLFLHYTFDIWMARNHPNIPFERYRR